MYFADRRDENIDLKGESILHEIVTLVCRGQNVQWQREKIGEVFFTENELAIPGEKTMEGSYFCFGYDNFFNEYFLAEFQLTLYGKPI